MKLLKVVDAKHIDKYEIELTFNNGESGIVNLQDKIFNDHRKIFEPLQDVDYFKNFIKNRWTVEWPNGLDLAPEFLYDLVNKQASKTI